MSGHAGTGDFGLGLTFSRPLFFSGRWFNRKATTSRTRSTAGMSGHDSVQASFGGTAEVPTKLIWANGKVILGGFAALMLLAAGPVTTVVKTVWEVSTDVQNVRRDISDLRLLISHVEAQRSALQSRVAEMENRQRAVELATATIQVELRNILTVTNEVRSMLLARPPHQERPNN